MGSRQIVLVSTAGISVLNAGIFWREAKKKRLFSQCDLHECQVLYICLTCSPLWGPDNLCKISATLSTTACRGKNSLQHFQQKIWQINICTENSWWNLRTMCTFTMHFNTLPKKLRAKSMVDLRSVRPHLCKKTQVQINLNVHIYSYTKHQVYNGYELAYVSAFTCCTLFTL